MGFLWAAHSVEWMVGMSAVQKAVLKAAQLVAWMEIHSVGTMGNCWAGRLVVRKGMQKAVQ